MNGAPAPVGLRTILGGGFGVLRAQPASVLIWALVYGAATAAFSFAPRAGLRIEPEPGTGANANALAPVGSSLLVTLFFLSLFVILFTAAMRSVLRPSGPGLAFLRLGMEELRQIGLCLFLLILFYVGLIIVGAVVGLAVALIFASAGAELAIAIAIGLAVAILLALVSWLAVRLSLSPPLTLLRGSITISESWRLTRGRFWKLFGGFLIIYLLLLFLSLGAAAVTMGDYWATIARDGFTRQSLEAATQAQLARQLGPIDFRMVSGWVLTGLAAGIGVALQGGAVAAVARELADVRAAMAETFA